MEKSIWLSYDLGIQGDYSHMYAWLDNHGAVECGDSFAFFKYSVNMKDIDDDGFLDALRKELESSVSFRPGDRVYVVRHKDDRNRATGRFIIGKRKTAPWEGYGDKGGDDKED